jgi:dihydroxyacetone kinase
MSDAIKGTDVVAAVRRAGQALMDQRDYLTSLDQALGDGDLGITMNKAGEALIAFADANPCDDIGKYLFQLGTVTNRAASSTMGTLTAGALMSAGKVVRDRTELSPDDLTAIFQAVDESVRTRGKANPGDKTVVDALHPASVAFGAAIAGGATVQQAAADALAAARAGRDSVTPVRSKVGRAGWIGERTEGQIDPGCAMFVLVLEALAAG